MSEIKDHCWVVTVLECDTNNPDKEAPEGCCECGMLDYLCFNTVEEANESFIKNNFTKKGIIKNIT